MAHDGDDGRTQWRVGVVLVDLEQLLQLDRRRVGDIDDVLVLHLEAPRQEEACGLVEVEEIGDRRPIIVQRRGAVIDRRKDRLFDPQHIDRRRIAARIEDAADRAESVGQEIRAVAEGQAGVDAGRADRDERIRLAFQRQDIAGAEAQVLLRLGKDAIQGHRR